MLQIEPVAGALGAVVRNADLAMADRALASRLREVLDQYLVAYLPDQNLDRFQLSALAHLFGLHFLHPLVNNGFDDCPEVLELRREPGETVMFESWVRSWGPEVQVLRPRAMAERIAASLEAAAAGHREAAASFAEQLDEA